MSPFKRPTPKRLRLRCAVCEGIFYITWIYSKPEHRRYCRIECAGVGHNHETGNSSQLSPPYVIRRQVNGYLAAELAKLETYKRFLRERGIAFDEAAFDEEAILTLDPANPVAPYGPEKVPAWTR